MNSSHERCGGVKTGQAKEQQSRDPRDRPASRAGMEDAEVSRQSVSLKAFCLIDQRAGEMRSLPTGPSW